jgi:hypothetical protein
MVARTDLIAQSFKDADQCLNSVALYGFRWPIIARPCDRYKGLFVGVIIRRMSHAIVPSILLTRNNISHHSEVWESGLKCSVESFR